LLGEYRVNGPYHDFIRRYTRFARHLNDFLPELHVISEKTKQRMTRTKESREWLDMWIGAEDKAQEARLPFVVLHDEAEEIGSALDSPGSPHILAIDSHGVIVHDGDLDEIEVWKVLGKIAPAKAAPYGP